MKLDMIPVLDTDSLFAFDDAPIEPVDLDRDIWRCVCERCRACDRPHPPYDGRLCHLSMDGEATFLFCCEREWVYELLAELIGNCTFVRVESDPAPGDAKNQP